MAAGVAALALAAGGYAVATVTSSPQSVTTTTAMGCEDWGSSFTSGECFAAGTIRFVSLYNLQGAAQFCVWRKANPGEWLRLKTYASDGQAPQRIVTWFGGSIRNQLEAYFATGAPMFSIQPNTSPNVCKTPLPPPAVRGVTPGQTDATVTVTTS